MKQKRIGTGTAVVALLAVSTAALAQYTGPGNRAKQALPTLRTVSEVLRDPIDDQPVQLTGVLLRQTGHESFEFRDASGQIQVEIDDDEFPAGQPIDSKTTVTLVGEVETRALRAPEIDVEQLIVTPAGAPATTH